MLESDSYIMSESILHKIFNFYLMSGIVIQDRKFTNKTSWRMGISRMAEAQIPIDKGMLVIGHGVVKSYNQYNTNLSNCRWILVKKSSPRMERNIAKFCHK